VLSSDPRSPIPEPIFLCLIIRIYHYQYSTKTGHKPMGLGVNRKYGTIEVLFAVGILAAGIFGLLFSFLLGKQPMAVLPDDDVTTPASEAMSLFQRVLTEPDPAKPGTPIFLSRIIAGNEWIHSAANTAEPVRVRPESSLYWSCRVSKNAMDQIDLSKDSLPIHTYPDGKYQIAIFVYRNVQPGVQQLPVATYSSVVSPGGPTAEDQPKTDSKSGAPNASRLPDPEADYKRLRSKK
jgi:hypothetical protein